MPVKFRVPVKPRLNKVPHNAQTVIKTGDNPELAIIQNRLKQLCFLLRRQPLDAGPNIKIKHYPRFCHCSAPPSIKYPTNATVSPSRFFREPASRLMDTPAF